MLRNRLRKYALTVFIFASLLCSAACAEGIKLQVGEQYIVDFDGDLKRAILSHPEHVEAVLLRNHIVLKALQSGTFELRYWLASGAEEVDTIKTLTIHVVPAQRRVLMNFLELLFEAQPSMKFIETDSVVWVHGDVSPQLNQQLIELAEQFDDLNLSQVRINPEHAEMLEFEIQVVEVSERGLKNIGVQWGQSSVGPNIGYFLQSSFEAGIGSEVQFQGFLNWDLNVSSIIHMLNQRGQAEILATPKLRVIEGRVSEFHAGGEIPIPRVNGDGNPTIEFHPYGVKVQVQGVLTQNNKINVTLHAELSNLDSGVAVQGVPGLLTRKTDTQVEVELGETVIISGLKSLERHQYRQSLPSKLAQYIGKLGSYQMNGQQNTELVIFLTPKRMHDIRNENIERLERRQYWNDVVRDFQCN